MRISDWSSDVCSSDLDAGDNVHGWALRRHDKVDACRPGLLRKALDQEFYFLARRHHPVGQLVHNDDYLRQWVEIERSDKRRVGKECVSTCRSRWLPLH